MGYRGKLAEREQARRLRAAGLPLAETDRLLAQGRDRGRIAVADPSIRLTKRVHGGVSIGYSCSATHRSIMGLVGALLGDAAIPG